VIVGPRLVRHQRRLLRHAVANAPVAHDEDDVERLTLRPRPGTATSWWVLRLTAAHQAGSAHTLALRPVMLGLKRVQNGCAARANLRRAVSSANSAAAYIDGGPTLRPHDLPRVAHELWWAERARSSRLRLAVLSVCRAPVSWILVSLMPFVNPELTWDVGTTSAKMLSAAQFSHAARC
jgi:hypothetical protein